MYIEVTDKDVEAVCELIGCGKHALDCVNTKELIAAAYEVMKRKHQDDLAEAVKEAIQKTGGSLGVEFSEVFGSACLVEVVSGMVKEKAKRVISLDDNFPTLAAAAVRDLSRQVRQ